MLCLVFFATSVVVAKAERASVTLYDHKSDDKLWVHIRKPNVYYHELLVYLPDGEPVYLVLFGYTINSQLENFARRYDFKMPIEDLMSLHIHDGKKTMSKLFDQEGIYTFYFAGNVETEPQNTEHDYIKVTYPPK